MDDKLVGSSLSESAGDEENAPRFAYTDTFYKVFPMYLAIGMTYDQFWNDDVDLVKYYRQANEIRKKQKNEELWLQGMYFYEALCDVAPIYRTFAKAGTKPVPYSDAPYALTQKEQEKREEIAEKQEYEKGIALMNALMKRQNGGEHGS